LKPDTFQPRLESLRGIAALAVAVYHSISVFKVQAGDFGSWLHLPLRVLGNGGAVLLFFVLSGYVLTLSLRRMEGSAAGLGAFYLRRATRLGPPLAAAAALGFLALQVNATPYPAAVTEFYAAVIPHPPNGTALVKNLALVEYNVIPPSWTIRVEAVWSLLLPLLVWADARLTDKLRAILFLALLAASVSFPNVWTVRFGYAFYLGCLLTRLPIGSRPPLALLLAVAGAVVFFLGRFAVPDLPAATDATNTAGGALLIAAILCAPRGAPFGFMDLGPIRALGRVSYSFYLLHFSVLHLCMAGTIVTLPSLGMGANLAALVTSIPLAAALAALSYRFIEEPAIRAGRRTAARFA
jgi:peptidoglycan/LPS O-acetylase OafA/YrhL